eukprot:scaffold56631_cov33-Tisochrysis_lutea.AAC.3
MPSKRRMSHHARSPTARDCEAGRLSPPPMPSLLALPAHRPAAQPGERSVMAQCAAPPTTESSFEISLQAARLGLSDAPMPGVLGTSSPSNTSKCRCRHFWIAVT